MQIGELMDTILVRKAGKLIVHSTARYVRKHLFIPLYKTKKPANGTNPQTSCESLTNIRTSHFEFSSDMLETKLSKMNTPMAIQNRN